MKIVEYDVKITGIDENGDQHIIPLDEYFYEQIDEAINEIVLIREPIFRELSAKRLSEITKISEENILISLNNIINKREKFKSMQPHHIDEKILYESKKDQFSISLDYYNRPTNMIEFADRSYYRTGSLSTDSEYDKWAIGVYNEKSQYDRYGKGPHLRTSYGTFAPDSWDIGFIKLNGKEYYCFGTLENRTITLNFPKKYSID